jgi:hypothetical protein
VENQEGAAEGVNKSIACFIVFSFIALFRYCVFLLTEGL